MRKILIGVAVLFLASCAEMGIGEFSSFSDGSDAVNDTANREYYPDDQLIVSAKAQFRERNFGRSYRLFKEALDVVPEDPAAWLGYAASADMLRRFDKAEFAYKKLQPVIGNRIEFLNNYGYSHLLRGNLRIARQYFIRAYELDPQNETAANNLELLRNSVNYPKRVPGGLQGI